MASASSSTDQTKKETVPASPAMSHSPAGENHVTTAINSNTQNSATGNTQNSATGKLLEVFILERQ